MPAVSGYVDAPLQGISQAAAAVRLPTQASRLVDSIVEPQRGWRKRPPMQYLGKVISNGSLTTSGRQKILTDPDDGTLVLLHLDTAAGATTAKLIKLTDLSSPAVTISAAAHTYLNTSAPAPQVDLRVLSALDTNLITNRLVPVVDTATTSATRPHEALIWVKSGGFGWKFNITISGGFTGSPITGYYQLPDGSDADQSLWVTTNAVVLALLNGTYNGGAGNSAVSAIGTALATGGFTVSHDNSVIYLTNTADFVITSDDAQGGSAFVAVKDTVQSFDGLPKIGPQDDMVVEVTPTNPSNTGGNYWVQYDKAGRVWRECLAPGIVEGIDPLTLPVALIKAAGTWGIDSVAWKNRQVGDLTSAPDPGIVGQTVSDCVYYDGRLGLLYNEGLLFGAADDPFRLYPGTVVTTIDSDPFEALNPDSERAYWEWSCAMYGGLALIGKRSQTFLQNADVGSFTVKSVNSKVIARYQLDTPSVDSSTLQPAVSNDRLYLATPRTDDWLAFFEFSADRISTKILPDDVAAHVPELLPNTLDRVASVDPQFALLYGSSGRTGLYLGLFRYANFQRVQTAWYQWEIRSEFTLAGLVSHGAVYYLLLRDAAGNGHLVSMNLDPDFLDDDAASTVLTKLDMRCKESQCAIAYSAVTGFTTITPPIPVDATVAVSARAGAGAKPEGYLAQVESYTAATITVRGDWSAQAFYIGYQYIALWEPSTIYRRSQDQRPIVRAPLILNDILLDVSDAINLKAIVQQPARATKTYLRGASGMGLVPVQFTGQWQFPVNGRNTRVTIAIEDTSHLGSKVDGFEWFGHQDPRFQRTT